MQLQDLPTEVLSSIIADLPRDDIRSVAQTSKLCRGLALPILFRSYSIATVLDSEWHSNVEPSVRKQRLERAIDLLSSSGAAQHVRELTLALPPAEVKFDSWKQAQHDDIAQPILSDEMLKRLLSLLPTLTGTHTCDFKFESALDYVTAYKILSALPRGESTPLRKLTLYYCGGHDSTNAAAFNSLIEPVGDEFNVPGGLTKLGIDLQVTVPNITEGEGIEQLPAHERAVSNFAWMLLKPSLKTLTRLSLKVGMDLNGTEDCHSHVEIDLEKLAVAPLVFLDFVARKKEDDSDNIPKICKLWPELEELRVAEYWPARHGTGADNEGAWCGGMELVGWKKQWLDSMKSLKKLKTLFLAYDLERQAGDIQEDIFNIDEDDDDAYPHWEQRNTKRRRDVSEPIAKALPLLSKIEWMNKMDDGNESEYIFNIMRGENGEVLELEAEKQFWDLDDEGEDDEDGGDEDGEDGDDDDDDQEDYEGVLDFNNAEGEDAEGEDAEGEDAEGEDVGGEDVEGKDAENDE